MFILIVLIGEGQWRDRVVILWVFFSFAFSMLSIMSKYKFYAQKKINLPVSLGLIPFYRRNEGPEELKHLPKIPWQGCGGWDTPTSAISSPHSLGIQALGTGAIASSCVVALHLSFSRTMP